MSPVLRGAVDAELLAQVVEVSADAIWTEDLDGVVTTWNAAAERLYGWPAAKAVGSTTTRLDPPQDAPPLRRAWERARAGERVERFTAVQQRTDGALVTVSLTVSPLRDAGGGVVGLAVSAQDVTERTALAAELQRATAELERREQGLLRSNRDLEQFAYVASHDLSEPLRVVTGYVQLLERRYADALDERGERYVKHVVEGCARMRQLIDDLLHYSRFLRQDVEPAAVDTRQAVEVVLQGLAAATAEAGATVVVADLHPVRCDPAGLRVLLQNLLGNAVKFSRPGHPPRVEVSTVRTGDEVVLRVDDDGIGVAPQFREKVFRMFQRLHVREDYGGTGIGLAVVQKVAEQAGGRAWVEDSPLGGARFCAALPAADETETAP